MSPHGRGKVCYRDLRAGTRQLRRIRPSLVAGQTLLLPKQTRTAIPIAGFLKVPFCKQVGKQIAHLLARNLTSAGALPLGGAGGGVQVLSVMEARARTFDHLFVLGMNRDVFPRSIREDPLLGDSLRRSLADMLPSRRTS